MNKALKIVAIVLLGAVLVVVAAVAAVLFLVDPNDYKGEIAAAVEQKTGRTLAMDGDIGLTLFPWLALDLQKVALSDAPGFGEGPFAKVERAELRVKLMPLLEKRLEMDTLVLHGLEVNLQRRADGVANWEDLTAGDKAKAPVSAPSGGEEAAGGAPPLAALAIGGVDLRGATVRWRDRAAGVAYSLEGVDLTTGKLVPGEPVELSLSGRFASEAPKVAGQLRFGGRITVDPASQQVKAEGLKLTVGADGEALPGGHAELALAAEVVADGLKQTFDATGLDMKLLGLPLRGELHGAGGRLTGQLDSGTFDPRPLLAGLGSPLPEGATVSSASLSAEFSADSAAAEVKGFKFSLGELNGEGALKLDDFAKPRYSGRFQAGYVDLRKLLAALGQAVPETADPKAMTKVGVRTTFEGTASGVKLANLEFALDESYLHGPVRVSRFSPPAAEFDLNLNQIDIDRYLPPPAAADAAAAPAPAPAAPAAAQPVASPLAPLLALDLAGKLAIDKLKAAGVSVEALTVHLKAKDGVVTVDPADARLYEGSYHGSMRLDARGGEPRFHIEKSLQGVRIGPLLRDLTGQEEKIDGRGNVSINVSSAGLEPAAITRSLDGDIRFSLRNGAVKGVNVAQLLREASAKLKGKSVPAADTNQTDFTELTGSVRIDKGVAVNRDLSAKSPLLRLAGEGSADLPNQRLDYGVKVAVVGTLRGQGGEELKDLEGVTIPLRASGPFNDLSYKLDLGQAVKEKAKAKIEKKVNEKLKGQFGDKLKGLFGK
ncbi:AsmA family protein [Endothiovibrio diazotrophicus]